MKPLRPRLLVPGAALVLILIGIFVGWEHRGGGLGSDRLRGAPPMPGATERGSIRLLEPTPVDSDGIRLTWHPAATAASYDLAIFGGNLEDLARIRSIADTTYVVRRRELRPEPARDAVVGWRVTGLREGAAVAESPIGTFRLR